MRALFLALSVAWLPAPAVEALRWPELPLALRFEEVLDAAHVGDWPVRVRRFHSPLPPQEVLMKIESDWRVRPGPTLRTRQGGWEILSAWGESQVSNVQVRPDRRGGTEGLLSVWSRQSAPATGGTAVALVPDGARILRDVRSEDAGRAAHSVVATLDASPDVTRERAIDRLRAAGFRAILPAPARDVPSQGRSATILRDGSRELLLTVMPLGTQTGLVLHLRTEAP